MRLHRVAVQAFGPFAERVEVDVDALAVHGLFLLHGPTGAGKTSLLDAVCFALYGVVPGARSSLRQATLRSDHAEPGVPPLVEVELTVGHRRLEVRRSPAWQRPRARGTGTTTEQASVRVREKVGGRWEPLSTRLDEAGHLLSSLLGMDAQQFTTVVLLPQGDFATFLRAGPDDRRSVLERLFGTDRFAAVEGWLAERRTEAGRALRETRGRRDQLLARVDERSAPLREADPALVETTTPDPAGACGLYAVAAARLDDTRALLTSRQRDLDRARQRAEQHAATERLDRERLQLLVQHEELAEQSDLVRSLRLALSRDTAAATVAPHGERCRQVTADLEQARTALDAALERLPRAARSRDPQVLTERADAVGGEVAVLATLLPQEADLVRHRAALTERLDHLAALDREHASVVAAEAALAATEVALGADRQLAERTASRLGTDRTDLRRAEAVREGAAAVLRLTPAVRGADDRAREADVASSRARAAHLDLVERRLAGMAAELAGSLVEGQDCPVCGAVEHPAPATGTVVVDRARVEQALRTAAGLEVVAAVEREARDALVRELAAAAQVAGGLDAEGAERAVHAAREAVETAETAAAAAARLDLRLATTVQERAGHRSRLTEVEHARTAVRDSLTELRTRVSDTEVRLGEARGSDATVLDRHRRLTAELAALTTAATGAREVPGARRAVTTARRQAERAAVAAGLGSLDDALTAAMPPSERAAAEAAVAEHQRRSAGVEQRLAHPDLAQADLAHADLTHADLTHADLTATSGAGDRPSDRATTATAASEVLEARVLACRAAKEEVERAETEVRRAAADVTVLESTAVALHGLAEELARHDDRSSAAEQEAAVLEELAACALGTSVSNTLRMRLSAYVLAARLEQVAAAASVRLRATSAGRYELRHCDARGRGSGRSGLGLVVVDHWTGQERATATLSGGETFLASLALALGLADVVQAESGGLAIETLFVDEGFGSLDDDTLEQVMAGLDELRQGGRAIGLVSHLPELRSRIPSQLHVVRGERGSTVRVRRLAG